MTVVHIDDARDPHKCEAQIKVVTPDRQDSNAKAMALIRLMRQAGIKITQTGPGHKRAEPTAAFITIPKVNLIRLPHVIANAVSQSWQAFQSDCVTPDVIPAELLASHSSEDPSELRDTQGTVTSLADFRNQRALEDMFGKPSKRRDLVMEREFSIGSFSEYLIPQFLQFAADPASKRVGEIHTGIIITATDSPFNTYEDRDDPYVALQRKIKQKARGLEPIF